MSRSQGRLTPPPEMVVPVQRLQTDQPSGKMKPMALLTAISISLGIILTTGVVISGLGKAFFVDRNEYNTQLLKDVKDKTEFSSAVEKLTQTLSRQETAFEKMSLSIQAIQIEMAKKR